MSLEETKKLEAEAAAGTLDQRTLNAFLLAENRRLWEELIVLHDRVCNLVQSTQRLEMESRTR